MPFETELFEGFWMIEAQIFMRFSPLEWKRRTCKSAGIER